MKTKYVVLFLPLLFVLSACIINSHPDYPDPEACFKTTYTRTFVGEKVKFTNCSRNAKQYEWDFGDGTVTDIPNPIHVFTESGLYSVTLTAIGEDGTHSFAARDIEVKNVSSADLDIIVKHMGTNDPVADCQVTLYANEQDWLDLKNPVSETLVTNANGQVFFYDIVPAVYYVDAQKPVDAQQFYSNEKLGNTVEVFPETMNRYDIEVELLQSSKKSAKIAKPAKQRK
ncbi:MAG: hypothetical protein CSB06_02980 [Bacteroidia bacterium]|nr:MAG: hypothetical protein CSB06_02980 [Bacteroidia bacterium]